jgi:NADH-quinone oxidoreductase subunit N
VNVITSALVHVFPLIVPEGLLVLAACVLFLGGTFRAGRNLWGGVAVASLVVAAVALWFNPLSPRTPDEAAALKLSADKTVNDALPQAVLFAGPLLVDRLALLIKAIAVAGGLVLVLTGWKEVPDRNAAEFHACVLLITAGIMLTGAANELVTLFLALELVSIPTYVLLYLQRTDNPAQEAAMKYFLLSVFSSALLLFGFSYLYGLAGTTNLPAIAEALGRTARSGLPGVGLVALVMVVAGLGFRITAVPFHFYAPDVYQGTTSSAAALLAFVPKLAGFIALLRVLGFVPHELPGVPGGLLEWELLGPNKYPDLVLGAQVPRLLWILAVVTMSLGNVLALLQSNVKRLLAYSSVANAGYLLVGLVVARFLPAGYDPKSVGVGVDAVLFYLVAYGAMTVGAFAVLTYLSTPQRPVETIDDLAGLGRSHPGPALTLTLFLFSLIGIPASAGFVGKLLLFWGAISVEPAGTDPLWFRVLALIMAVNAAIGAWYYLKLAAVMYLRSPLRPLERVRSWPGLAALALCVIVTLGAGLYPKALLDQIDRSLPRGAPEARAAGQDLPGARALLPGNGP